ncbi:hypothetical protein [Thermococcus thermotolerans]|uniref:hypothetical protein n=1 Tax=Thermococcus thermotolerans TaxID=2969672 RepID=UPI002157B3C1|nr:hypothetical protein [Thermococcus thermotolerans]
MVNLALSISVAGVILIGILPLAMAIPYWAGNASLTYEANYYAPYVDYRLSQGDKPEWITTSILIYNYSGVLYIIKTYGSTTLEFHLKRDGRFVDVTAEIILKNVNVSAFLPPGISPPSFWNESKVISTKVMKSHYPGFEDWKWYIFHLRELTIVGKYRIRVNDSMVIKDGTVYGHTMLWDDPMNPLTNDSPFSIHPLSTRIKSVQIDNDNVFRIRNITIEPPTKLVVTTPYSYNLTQHLRKDFLIENNPYSAMIFRFDASGGILLSTFQEAPDFWALGVLSASFVDEYSLYQVEVKGDKFYLTGLVLENFTTKVESTGRDVRYPRPKTGLKWMFYASIAILAGVLVWNLKLVGVGRR